MYLKILISSLSFMLFSLFSSYVYATDKVGEVWTLPDIAMPEGKIAYIDPVQGLFTKLT